MLNIAKYGLFQDNPLLHTVWFIIRHVLWRFTTTGSSTFVVLTISVILPIRQYSPEIEYSSNCTGSENIAATTCRHICGILREWNASHENFVLNVGRKISNDSLQSFMFQRFVVLNKHASVVAACYHRKQISDNTLLS